MNRNSALLVTSNLNRNSALIVSAAQRHPSVFVPNAMHRHSTLFVAGPMIRGSAIGHMGRSSMMPGAMHKTALLSGASYSNYGYSAGGDEIGRKDATLGPQSALPTEIPGEKPKEKHQTVAYIQLFRYATAFEKFMVILGTLLGIATGLCVPLFILLYGEYTSLLVDRNSENVTSNRAPVINFFGGGRILVDGTLEERKDAILEDAKAFCIGAVSASCLQFVIGVISVTALNYSALKQVTRVRQMFLRALFRQDQTYHDVQGTANIASRLTDDLDKLQDGIGEKIGIFMFLVVSFISSVIMALCFGWKLTLVVLSCAPIVFICQSVVSKLQSSLTVQELISYGTAGAVVEEVLGAIRTVAAFGGEKKEVERYTDKLKSAQSLGTKRGLYSGIGAGILWFIIYCSYGLAFWYGVTLILQDRDAEVKAYTPAIIAIVLFGVLAGALNMGLAVPHIEAFGLAKNAATEIYRVIEHEPGIDSLSEAGLRPKRITGEFELTGVHFQYPARPDVKILTGLTLKIPSGKTMALVGHSGCGKSTALQLIQRLYDPGQGSVKLDGVDLKDLNIQWLRSHIGVVGQEPVLFDTTIGENIRNGAEGATDHEIEEAAKEANAHDFIVKMPLGYNTMVGERGAQLSGGQKQRIAIARALVRRPTILLLDEATSALDRAGEAKVQAALDKASKGRTTIVVSHRLATIRSAHCIVVFANGKAVEQGTHDQLMELKGRYYDLVAADNAHQTSDDPSADPNPVEVRKKRQSAMPQERQASEMHSTPETNVGTVDKDEDESYPAPFGRIIGLNKPEWPHILVGCFAALIVGSSLPAFAVLFGQVYKVLSLPDPDEVRKETNLFAILFVVIGILTGLGNFFQTYMFSIVGVRLTMRLRTGVFSSILHQEIGWFDSEKNSVGALCARLAGDTSNVQGATGARLAVIVQAMATLLVGIILSLCFSWKLTLVSIVSIPITLSAVYFEARHSSGAGLEEKAALEGATKVAIEAISQIRTVASLGGETAVLRRYDKELKVAELASRRKTRMRGFVFSLGQAAPFFCYGLSFYYGGYLVAREGMPYENIIIVGEALIFGAWMLGQSLAYAPNLSGAKLSASRLFYLLDRKPLVGDSMANPSPVRSLSGDIEFSKVEFAYPTRPNASILRGLNLTIKAGHTVALVGASGCGKSTCIQLLQRLYDPRKGIVRLAGHNINSVPLAQLRRELGIVSQEPVLFDRTIADNIAYGDNERVPTMEEIIRAAENANVHAFIKALPLGYNTSLGLKGTQLSGGQKQRIAIARALLRNPKILLLDEATSALDTQSEKIVQAALDKARAGRTCITIAHRLATIQNADMICVFNQGRVVESGTHAELMALKGQYYQLQQQTITSIPAP